MNKFPALVISELTKRNKYVIPVVELYPRETIDITSIGSPANAIGRFSNVCYTWTNSTGSYQYDAKIVSFPEVRSYLGSEINTAEIEFSNVKRGEGSMSRFILDNKIKGCWMVIRLIYPDAPEESTVVFWGKCRRPGEITTTSVTLIAKQELGNHQQEIPFREFQVNCPLEFARPGHYCLGDQTLEQKSLAYRQAVANFGTAGCNKRFTTCVSLGNTNYFQGQRVVATSGQFTYITIEEVVKRVLFWTKKKKKKILNVENWSSVNQSENSGTIPMAFGRCQIQGHPFTWADLGTSVKSLQGFCEGKISDFDFIRSRTEGINILQTIEHLGEYGGVGTQVADTLFNGTSGVNSKLAYLEVLTDGSTPTQVDDAPIITAVIKGLEVPLPDSNGNYTLFGWTNNPVHYIRFVLTDMRFGRIPEYRIDDVVSLDTAYDCDTLVEDRTNGESIVLPSNEFSNYNINYRRYRSSGRYTAYKDMYVNDPANIDGPLFAPEFEEPYVQWFNPFEPYTVPAPNVVLRQKYTFNGALSDKISILEFLNELVFPTFKGFLNYGPNGKIQIRNKRKADNSYIRSDTKYLDEKVSVFNVLPWVRDNSGYLLVGVSLETAEICEVVGIEYSTACNNMPITVTTTGGVSASTSITMSGGSKSAPAYGYIDIEGSISAGSTVAVTFDDGDDAFVVSYSADGTENAESFARMLTAYLNANPQFNSFLSAYVLNSNLKRIIIRCETGYLNLNKGLEYIHTMAEEVLRVQYVFENCGELTANISAQYDNIVTDSFKWNSADSDEINAVVAKYTSAVDDFHLASILPRAAWDTIDLEGELSKMDMDLSFVDNYWQAAYLAKCKAIELIDGGVDFSWQSDMLAAQLELGDVVAVRHDSGDGVLNYIPVWLDDIGFDLNTFHVNLHGWLYLSAAHDLHVQPIDALLTTTLNPTDQETVMPPSVGTTGGTGGGTEPQVIRPGHEYYEQFNIAKYSPTGVDIV